MFVKAQNGKLLNLSQLREVEVVDAEGWGVWGFYGEDGAVALYEGDEATAQYVKEFIERDLEAGVTLSDVSAALELAK